MVSRASLRLALIAALQYLPARQRAVLILRDVLQWRASEVAVHGWDISQACGQNGPIPDALATTLLGIAPLLIPETGRHPLFSLPVRPAAQASPGDGLLPSSAANPRHNRFGWTIRHQPRETGHCSGCCPHRSAATGPVGHEA